MNRYEFLSFAENQVENMSISNIRILAIDDDVDVLTALRLLLKGKVKEIITEKNPNNLVSLIKSSSFDLIILDMNFNGMINTGNEGLYWLNKIKETDANIDVILITAYGEIDLAINQHRPPQVRYRHTIQLPIVSSIQAQQRSPTIRGDQGLASNLDNIVVVLANQRMRKSVTADSNRLEIVTRQVSLEMPNSLYTWSQRHPTQKGITQCERINNI